MPRLDQAFHDALVNITHIAAAAEVFYRLKFTVFYHVINNGINATHADIFNRSQAETDDLITFIIGFDGKVWPGCG